MRRIVTFLVGYLNQNTKGKLGYTSSAMATAPRTPVTPTDSLLAAPVKRGGVGPLPEGVPEAPYLG